VGGNGAGTGDLLVLVDYLSDDEAQKLLAERGIEVGLGCQRLELGDLLEFALRVRRRLPVG